ncbi:MULTISPECIES: TIGR02391 family protein [Brevibacillus]|uniref:TIGR02391 family protein n=1 Tax=Brevibacillus TaxID=55080 RepID=UPI000D0ED044|nr:MULTISPECIES: TIGR02391 family protein [Brevibacillus]MED1948275.1 TIGR02391 family protein [Brevibacillus formosus]MED1997994.1 TIGR02391 family protein [Brevibacillus formosus]MED2080535.1 TIGR02391 family protein [Brevibacillus formosus]PSK13727.1 TIGR02391 family protein [Brevibacillus sp. NRRL NRS-603]
MDLKVNIQQDLWEAIEKNYENESYSSAILDTIHLLTETIRNKTGLEGDGASLIGQAFSGDNPKIQINKLQTESEKNVQRGMQELIRGLYTAIRNPRSHDKHSDTKAEADAIIYFIDYLLKIINKSKASFEETTFLNRVFEKYYVKTEEYSKLLVDEIPKRQRTNIAIEVILQRKKGDVYNLESFLAALFDELDENDISQVYKVISEELKYTSSDEDIRTILHIAPGKLWSRVDKVVKIRIENMLLETVISGKYDTLNKRCRFGSLGTWIKTEHLTNFEDISQWTRVVVNKVIEGDDEERAYIQNYFWHKICAANRKNLHNALEYYFRKGLQNKDDAIVKQLKFQIQFDENHPWWKVFEEELIEYPEIKYIDFPF